MPMLSDEQRTALRKVTEKWNSSKPEEDAESPIDWRTPVLEKMESGDASAMRKAALPSAQYEIIKIAHEAKLESVRLQAATYLLEQEGQGRIQRIEHADISEKLPTDQLMAIISSKLSNIQKLNPNFDLKALLSVKLKHENDSLNSDFNGTTLDVEFEETNQDF